MIATMVMGRPWGRKSLVIARTDGMAMSSSLRAPRVEMRPEGSGRHGLLRVSSMTELGWRWLAISTRSRVSHIHAKTRGRRGTRSNKDGTDGLVVREGPDKAVRPAKAVDGTTMVLKSLNVKSQSVLRWYWTRDPNPPSSPLSWGDSTNMESNSLSTEGRMNVRFGRRMWFSVTPFNVELDLRSRSLLVKFTLKKDRVLLDYGVCIETNSIPSCIDVRPISKRLGAHAQVNMLARRHSLNVSLRKSRVRHVTLRNDCALCSCRATQSAQYISLSDKLKRLH